MRVAVAAVWVWQALKKTLWVLTRPIVWLWRFGEWGSDFLDGIVHERHVQREAYRQRVRADARRRR